MITKRRSKLALSVGFLLLGFTAADLLGDVGGLAICSSDSAVELHEYLPHDRSSDDERPHEGSEHSEQHHIDDCFCCSRCVERSTNFVLPRGESITLVYGDTEALSHPGFTLKLYRPPQAS